MHSGHISIWFFNGVLLTAYGVLILGAGVAELISGHPPAVVLSNLHASVWWGGMMTVIGLFYLVKFRPGQTGK